MYHNGFDGKTVLVTGHTGFKGSWLTIYLRRLNARVVGYALPPPSQVNLFDAANLAPQVRHHLADVRDAAALQQVIAETQPDYIFHLAAQALVSEGYRLPRETFDINVMGTINLLEALRAWRAPCAVVIVATDKVYENREWHYGYRELDPLGGADPYSASKAAMEIAVQAYRQAYFSNGSPVRIASVRSGNVIGGGDWARDRIVPDAIRALQQGQPIRVRNPGSTRPWQHVLDPLAGYLWLAARLSEPDGEQYAQAWNFGPSNTAAYTVQDVVEAVIAFWGGGAWLPADQAQRPHEAGRLSLSIDKAVSLLRWQPVWQFADALRHTVHWYQRAAAAPQPQAIDDLCRQDIECHAADARALGAAWAD